MIVGAGPVGLMLSTCLARWGYRIKHVDNRAEPTPTGRADGIQPRSLDLLRNMGLKSAIMAHKPARVFEVAFWDPATAAPSKGELEAGENGIVRTGTWASCPAFIDARYPFTTLLHQGFIERVFLADMARHGVEVQRPWTIRDFRSDEFANPDYPVEVDLAHVDGSASETVRARYLFSGEGARSLVRDKLGIRITHKDPISHVWGVMDGVVRTDFPDIKVGSPSRPVPPIAGDRLTRVDEMHDTLGTRLDHGDTAGERHGAAVHPAGVVDGPGFRPAQNGHGGTGPGVRQENPAALLD